MNLRTSESLMVELWAIYMIGSSDTMHNGVNAILFLISNYSVKSSVKGILVQFLHTIEKEIWWLVGLLIVRFYPFYCGRIVLMCVCFYVVLVLKPSIKKLIHMIDKRYIKH